MNDVDQAASAISGPGKDKNLSLFSAEPKQKSSDQNFSFAIIIQQLCAKKFDHDLEKDPQARLASFSRFMPQDQAKGSVLRFTAEECRLHIAKMQRERRQAPHVANCILGRSSCIERDALVHLSWEVSAFYV
jgi:hypothetical protein